MCWPCPTLRRIDWGHVVRRREADAGGGAGNDDHLVRKDISAGSALGYFEVRFPELGWRATHPNLAPYMDGLMTRPSFEAAVPHSQDIASAVV